MSPSAKRFDSVSVLKERGYIWELVLKRTKRNVKRSYFTTTLGHNYWEFSFQFLKLLCKDT